MKVTTTKDFMIDNVKKVYLVFEDGEEVILDQIINYDLHLDNIDLTFVRFTNALINGKIMNRFTNIKLNKIKLIHLELSTILDLSNCTEELHMIDIPCNMKIRELQIDGEVHSVPNMYIELEGLVG